MSQTGDGPGGQSDSWPEAGEVWSAGRYETVAASLAPLAGVLLDEVENRLGALAGRRLLDVGAGTGNVALEAAARGAQVTALDPAARLLDVAAARAAERGFAIRTVVATAEAMPVPAGAFDAVVSCVGVVFARDRAAAVAGMHRATAPGGVLAVLAWQPDSLDHPFAAPVVAVVGAGGPPGGAAAPPPHTDWGVPETVRGILAAGGAPVGDVVFSQAEHTWRFGDVDAVLAFLHDSPGHAAVLRGTDDSGRARFREAAVGALGPYTGAVGLSIPSPYLITTARV